VYLVFDTGSQLCRQIFKLQSPTVFSTLLSLYQWIVVKNQKQRERNFFFYIPWVVCTDDTSARLSKYSLARELVDTWKMTSQFFLQVLVDRVRAGVISSWLPRRLGGGLGQRQKGTQRFAWKVRLHVWTFSRKDLVFLKKIWSHS